MMMYIKIDLFFIFPLVMTNLSYNSIVDIKLMAGPLCIAHLVIIGLLLCIKCCPSFEGFEETLVEMID